MTQSYSQMTQSYSPIPPSYSPGDSHIDLSPSMLTYESPVYIRMVTPLYSALSNQTMDIEYAQSMLSCKRRLDHEFLLEDDVIDNNEFDERNDADKYITKDGLIYRAQQEVRRSKRKMESLAKPTYFSHDKIKYSSQEKVIMVSENETEKLILRFKNPKKVQKIN